MYQYNRKGPKRGVALYSYSGEYGVSMDLENCFQDMYDMGAHGLEILANTHIPAYPQVDENWLEEWFHLLEKYEIVPVEYGHWIDSRLFAGRELTTEESIEILKRDIRIAHKLGFTVMRTKMGVIDSVNSPVNNWREIIRGALECAEENNVRMCPELHMPTALKSRYVDDYMEFILKENTKYFGFNVDFGTFQDVFESDYRLPGMPEDGGPCSRPEDMIPILPYVYCCHAKFNHMSEDFKETTIPYEKIIQILKDQNWDGYMLSEYEGPDKNKVGFVGDQLRRQHIMMQHLLNDQEGRIIC
ncbi:MAG: TIM barrel protein [Eubacteriales bacterium]|nr:TIM barrel protein [Eubacteriales bacterium]